MFRIRTSPFTVGAIVLAVAAAACSSSGSPAASTATDAAQVTDAVRSFAFTESEHDGDAFIDGLSAHFCTSQFEKPCEEMRAHSGDLFVDQPALDIRSIDKPVITADKATVDVTTRIQSALHHSHFVLARTDQRWLVDDVQIDAAPVAPPRSWPAVDVTLRDYSFDLDVSKLTSGNFALRIHNAGGQQHELSIKRVDMDASLAKALDPNAVQPPANTNFIPVASIAPVDPNADTTLVLAELLPPGHYFIFCELPDPDGSSHLSHGMATEFTVNSTR